MSVLDILRFLNELDTCVDGICKLRVNQITLYSCTDQTLISPPPPQKSRLHYTLRKLILNSIISSIRLISEISLQDGEQ